jgi:hypothetical protein
MLRICGTFGEDEGVEFLAEECGAIHTRDTRGEFGWMII